MPSQQEPLPVYTRAALRRLRPGRGPARSLPVRCQQPPPPSPEARPARAHNGRLLYVVDRPLPPSAPPRRPAPLARRREVG